MMTSTSRSIESDDVISIIGTYHDLVAGYWFTDTTATGVDVDLMICARLQLFLRMMTSILMRNARARRRTVIG